MVKLIPMTEEEFAPYLACTVDNYARDLARANNAGPDEAHQLAEEQFRELLPEGLSSPGQHLFSIWDLPAGEGAGTRVGFLWLGIRERGARAFPVLYDFAIYEPYRRQGYGTRALHALEARVRDLGFDEIRLHVFGHNHAAQALYEKLGYVPTNISMVKRLA